MNNINIRNILLVIVAILAVILGMNVLSTFVGAIIPIIITGIVGFFAGRATANRSMGQLFRSAQNASSTVMAAASKIVEEKPPATVTSKAAPPAPAAEKPVPKPATPEVKNIELLDPDFEIKTPDEVEAEARRLEAEVSQKAAAYDPKAALEERKKRLLGDKGNQ
ncbi:MAG: hypothetical protein R3E39_12665 [Anaerolineae bacterium]